MTTIKFHDTHNMAKANSDARELCQDRTNKTRALWQAIAASNVPIIGGSVPCWVVDLGIEGLATATGNDKYVNELNKFLSVKLGWQV